MDDPEFDKQIKENAQLQESGIEKPLWNKKGTWDRIESRLEKREQEIWWKIAVVILLFFSIGLTYAHWVEFNRYKSEKQLELSELQKQINLLSSDTETEKKTNLIILQQKNQEIDSLKNQLLFVQQKKAQIELWKSIREKSNISETIAKEALNERFIDSLKNNLEQLRVTALKSEQTVIQEQKPLPDQNLPSEAKEIVPERHVHYISNYFQSENIAPKKRGLKIGILGLPEDSGVKYKSDYSIFKK